MTVQSCYEMSCMDHNPDLSSQAGRVISLLEPTDNSTPLRLENAGQEYLLCSLGNGPRNCIEVQLNKVFLKAACGYLLQHYDWDQSLSSYKCINGCLCPGSLVSFTGLELESSASDLPVTP
ncbi:hypothetical protein J4Q44_G00132740 [Coregonus suidteri]|uniref:Uncharacterized protein n=1 Tax=Coregonus suidteri TaxID=861788 RepID=A0AAN8LNW8_9TELE